MIQQPITVKQLQEIFLGMMEEFHRFCVENQLKYYMVGGTLLGAVREKGFIPWDDDVDFAMPRPDYERFIKEYRGGMRLKCMQNDKTHLFPYIKLFHEELSVVGIEDEQYDIHSKVFVKFDIYPIDGVGCDKSKALALMKRVRQRKQLLYLNLTREKATGALKNIVLWGIRRIPSRIILRGIERKMKTHSYEKSTFLTRWREGGITANLVNRSVFGEPVLLPFEDHSFFAPQEYDVYLTHVYGNYMERKRMDSGLRHDTSANEITRSFKENLMNQD